MENKNRNMAKKKKIIKMPKNTVDKRKNLKREEIRHNCVTKIIENVAVRILVFQSLS